MKFLKVKQEGLQNILEILNVNNLIILLQILYKGYISSISEIKIDEITSSISSSIEEYMINFSIIFL